MIRPTEMLSAKTLADPRSKQARADLAKFAASERMVQLCNIEAMDQIRLKFRCELAWDGASVVGFEFQVWRCCAESEMGRTRPADGALKAEAGIRRCDRPPV